MAYYRTLAPLTYISGSQVITLPVPGTRVDLTPTEAASLQGLVVLDGTDQFTYPKADVLEYQYQVLFPAVGNPQVIYCADDTGLMYRWSETSQQYVPFGIPTNWQSVDTDERDDLLVGESTMSRRYITGSGATTTGTMVLGFFTARRTESITQVRTTTGSTAAVGSTLSRIAMFSVDSAGNLYLIASTANDATLWTAANTAYTETFSSSVNVVRGSRYAVGLLTVGASTAPSFLGSTTCPAAEAFLPPMLSAQVPSLSDLPSSVVAANLAACSLTPYIAVMP